MIGRALLGVFTALALAACGGGGEAPPHAEETARASPPIEAGPEPEPEPLGPEAVARAIAADSALEAGNRATYQRRLRSMGGYEECLAEARPLPPATRERIEAACESRREAP